MTNDQETEIANCLENIDLELEAIKGAMIGIDRAKAEIYDIMRGCAKDERYELDNQD